MEKGGMQFVFGVMVHSGHDFRGDFVYRSRFLGLA